MVPLIAPVPVWRNVGHAGAVTASRHVYIKGQKNEVCTMQSTAGLFRGNSKLHFFFFLSTEAFEQIV